MSLVSIARRPSVLSPAPSREGTIEEADRRYSHSLSETSKYNCNGSPNVTTPHIPSAKSADGKLSESMFTFSGPETANDSDSVELSDSIPAQIPAENPVLPDNFPMPSGIEMPNFNDGPENLNGSLLSANYYTIKGAAVFLNSQSSIVSALRPKTPIVKHDDSFFPSSITESPVPPNRASSSNFYSPPASPAPLLLNSNDVQRPSDVTQQAAEISRHLGLMLCRIRDEDQIMMAAKLESTATYKSRYLTLIRSSQPESPSSDNEIAALLGFDVTTEPSPSDDESDSPTPTQETVSLGVVIPVQADMRIRLTGDGGFTTLINERSYSFKPVAVQVMWACLHSIDDAISRANRNIRSSSGSLSSISSAWLNFYAEKIDSDAYAVADWQLMDDVISRLPPSDSESAIQRQIRDQLRTLMSSIDLEEVSSRTIRTSLETVMGRDLSAYRQYIDEEMLVLLGQLDLPSEIHSYLYLGSEWNASDIGMLKRLGITHIVNVSREIDNFFPSNFSYYNVRVYDDESTELLRYWNSVFRFIENARQSNGRILVHCKMGVSRSAACVIAYVMKADGKSRDEAIDFVRQRRECVQPNKGFMEQLHVYEGILKASKVRYSELFKQVDAIAANATVSTSNSPVKVSSLRPVSFYEEALSSSTRASADELFSDCLITSLNDRKAVFENSSKKESKHHLVPRHSLQERRQRNRTSPAFPSTFSASADQLSHRRLDKNSLFQITCSKEDVSVAALSADGHFPESGHVRRVTAQLLTPLLPLQKDSSKPRLEDNDSISINRKFASGLEIFSESSRNSWPRICPEAAVVSEVACEK